MDENHTTEKPGFDPSYKGEIELPEKLAYLRNKLYQKAKQEPKFRFYALMDRIYRKDTLLAAWKIVKKNQGCPGIDGLSIKDVEEGKAGPLLSIIQRELMDGSYKPQPVLRVYIPKANGKQRPLGIPTVKDRIIQTATLLILEPIFEADFLDCSYGFRPGKSAHQALETIQKNLEGGCGEIYDADLKGYFDTIPHDNLMECVKQRIADGRVLKLIRMWLKAPVVEKGKTEKPKKGTPQGGVISPLLSNVYLHWFEKVFHGKNGLSRLGAKIVRYADDFVIMAKRLTREMQDWITKVIEGKFELIINREKTRIIDMDKEEATLDFLGFSFRYEKDIHGRDKTYLNTFPSTRSVEREKANLTAITGPEMCFKNIPRLIGEINLQLKGWANYFRFGYPKMAFRKINSYVRQRLYRHLNRRSQRRYKIPEGETYYGHFKRLGLIYL